MSVSNGPNLGVMINATDGDGYGTAFRKLLRVIDAFVMSSVISKTTATPPGSPANGDRYIVAASPTGAWSGHTDAIACWTMDDPDNVGGVWQFFTPKAGWQVFNEADGTLYVWHSAAWHTLAVAT